MLVLVGVAGFGVGGCGSDSNEPDKTSPTINQPPPQPTTSTQKTGTPSTPSNTDRTTTAERADDDSASGADDSP